MRRHLAMVLAAGLLATACGQGPATAPPPPAGVQIRGQASVSMPAPASLDPAEVVDLTGEVVVRTMCDQLLDVDRVTGELVPSLVASWIVTDGGMRVVLRLRDGITFPDGSPVTSRDVVFSLSRAASAEFAGANADLLRGIRGYRVLRGQEEAREPRHRRELEGIRVLSASAFELNLDAGAQSVLPQLTHPTASIVSAAHAQRDPQGFAAAPMCVGPYRPTAPFDPDAPTFQLDRVDTYGGFNEAHAGGGQGFLERLVFHWTPTAPGPDAADDGVPLVASPRHDAHDIVLLDEGQLVAARADAARAVVLADRPTAQFVGLPDAQLGVEARRALSLALDRTRLAEVVGDAHAAALTAFLPPSMGSSLHRPDACPHLRGEADLPTARQVAADGGVDLRGVSLPLVTNADFDNVALLEEVARQWRVAFPGFNPQVRVEEWDAYRRRFENPDGFQTAFRTSNLVPYPSAFAWLSPYRTAAIGVSNGVAFADGVFDDLVEEEAARATDPVDQRVVFREAQDLLCDALPLLPLVHGRRAWSVAAGLASAAGDTQLLADPVTGGLRLRDLHRP